MAFNLENKNPSYNEKIYVALEDDGRVAVVDTSSKKLIKSINLSDLQNGVSVKYSAHNVQVTPDGSKVLVTANVVRGNMSESQEENENISDGLLDKIIIIDPESDTVVGSVPLGIDLHLAHVVTDSSGTFGYINSQETARVYIVDLAQKQVIDEIQLKTGSQPHGLRLSSDNKKLFIALIGEKAIADVDLVTKDIKYQSLPGKIVQTAVTPDSQYVFASVYDTKQIAWISVRDGNQGLIDLPAEARGAIQLYPTPDSQYLVVADQGYYFDQPTSNKVYKINVQSKQVEETILVGNAPHGVVVDATGKYAYVTNLLDRNISVVDLQSNEEVAKVIVGETPNGISIWNKENGGTP